MLCYTILYYTIPYYTMLEGTASSKYPLLIIIMTTLIIIITMLIILTILTITIPISLATLLLIIDFSPVAGTAGTGEKTKTGRCLKKGRGHPRTETRDISENETEVKKKRLYDKRRTYYPKRT